MPPAPAPQCAAQPIPAHPRHLNLLNSSTTETSPPTGVEFNHNKAHSRTFTICFELGGLCRLVGFLRRNVKAAWRVCQTLCICVSVCVCVSSYLSSTIFNRHGSQRRTSFLSCSHKVKKERRRYVTITAGSKCPCERPGVVGSDWTWVSCSERHLDGDAEEEVTGRERGRGEQDGGGS